MPKKVINSMRRKSNFSVNPLVLCALTACLLLPLSLDLANAQQPETGSTADLSGGSTSQPAIQTQNLLRVVQEGGPLMIPIGICSFVLFVFVFERAISLRRGRIIPRPFVKRFLEQLRGGQLDAQSAVDLCEKNRSPVAEVFKPALKKWGKPSVEVEQAIIDSGERVSNNLRRHLRLINGVATVSPLLGLLGTVVGMIRAFNAIATADAMGRPELLATGISQALLTTAAGLSVAIPALIMYLFFVSRVDRLIMDIDALGQQVVSLIASDGWDQSKDDGGKKRRNKAA
jgi:biopolymer transport protein ExbB